MVACILVLSPKRQEILLYMSISILTVNCVNMLLMEYRFYVADILKLLNNYSNHVLIDYGKCFSTYKNYSYHVLPGQSVITLLIQPSISLEVAGIRELTEGSLWYFWRNATLLLSAENLLELGRRQRCPPIGSRIQITCGHGPIAV